MNKTSMHVLIVGGGIAGSALAYWLHRYGIKATIVEKHAGLRKGGYRVDIRGAAAQVAATMGITGSIQAAATGLRGSSLVDHKGRRVVNLEDPDLFGMRQQGDIELQREDLAMILYQATRDYTEYIFNASVTNIVETSDSIVAVLDDGTERSFDLVIGADGLHSEVRRLTFADEDQLTRPLGYNMATFTVPNFLNLSHWELSYPSAARVINVYNDRHARKAHVMMLFAGDATQAATLKEQRELVESAFADSGWETDRLLDAMFDASDFYFETMGQVCMDELYRGRVALLGDAGYCASPASGQGTSMALVGAYILAGELAASGTDYLKGFASYQNQMMPFIVQNQKLALKMVQKIPRSQWQLRYRSAMIRILFRMPGRRAVLKRLLQQMQAAVNTAANGIMLQVYQPTL